MRKKYNRDFFFYNNLSVTVQNNISDMIEKNNLKNYLKTELVTRIIIILYTHTGLECNAIVFLRTMENVFASN